MVDDKLQFEFIRLAFQCETGEDLKDFVNWINQNYAVIYHQLTVINQFKAAGLKVGVCNLNEGDMLC